MCICKQCIKRAEPILTINKPAVCSVNNLMSKSLILVHRMKSVTISSFIIIFFSFFLFLVLPNTFFACKVCCVHVVLQCVLITNEFVERLSSRFPYETSLGNFLIVLYWRLQWNAMHSLCFNWIEFMTRCRCALHFYRKHWEHGAVCLSMIKLFSSHIVLHVEPWP